MMVFHWTHLPPALMMERYLGSRVQRAESRQHQCPQWNHAVGPYTRERESWRYREYFVLGVRRPSFCCDLRTGCVAALQRVRDVLPLAQRPGSRLVYRRAAFLWVAPPTAGGNRWRTGLSERRSAGMWRAVGGWRLVSTATHG
jgi:hypothetical protein